jgi:hypothetical protein
MSESTPLKYLKKFFSDFNKEKIKIVPKTEIEIIDKIKGIGKRISKKLE